MKYGRGLFATTVLLASVFFSVFLTTVGLSISEGADTGAFSIYNKMLNINGTLRAKLASRGFSEKIMPTGEDAQSMKIADQMIVVGMNQYSALWYREYYKQFTSKERQYLESLFTHPLLTKFTQFNKSFSSDKYDKEISTILQNSKKEAEETAKRH